MNFEHKNKKTKNSKKFVQKLKLAAAAVVVELFSNIDSIAGQGWRLTERRRVKCAHIENILRASKSTTAAATTSAITTTTTTATTRDKHLPVIQLFFLQHFLAFATF